MKCNLCNSERLLVSQDESVLMPGAKYCNCMDCGNMMILKDGTLIPTPTTDNMLVKAMIEDAAQSFKNNAGARLMSVSLNGTDIQVNQQPTTVKETLNNYINQFLDSDEEDEELDMDEEIVECNGLCDECADGCPDFEEKKAEAIKKGIPVYHESRVTDISINYPVQNSVTVEKVTANNKKELNDYLVLLPNGEKMMYRNCEKQFLLSIINSMGPNIELYQLNKIELVAETTYTF